MPAAKKGVAAKKTAAAPAPTAVKERKKPGPKPGSKRGPKKASSKVFKIFASDGDALTYITSIKGVNTGPQAVLQAVKEGSVEADAPVVPISERFLTPIKVEAEQREPVLKVTTIGAPRTKRKYTRRATAETNGSTPEPVAAAAEPAPAGSPAAAGNPFAA